MRYLALLVVAVFLLGASAREEIIVEELVERYSLLPCPAMLDAFTFMTEQYKELAASHKACLDSTETTEYPWALVMCHFMNEQAEYVGIIVVNLGEAYTRTCKEGKEKGLPI